MDVIIYPCWDNNYVVLVEGIPDFILQLNHQ